MPVGLYSVTYTATNKFAETPIPATCTFTLAVIDNVKPTFNCPNDQSRNPAGLYYTVDGAEFDLTNISDNCGIASVTHNYSGGLTPSSLAGAQFAAGSSHTIQWKVVDVHGNKDSCQFNLTLGDKVKPDITIN